MKITLSEGKDGYTRVYCDDKFTGFIKYHENHFLCYSHGRHTTTQNLKEVIHFFNGDYNSYYYRGNER